MYGAYRFSENKYYKQEKNAISLQKRLEINPEEEVFLDNMTFASNFFQFINFT